MSAHKTCLVVLGIALATGWILCRLSSVSLDKPRYPDGATSKPRIGGHAPKLEETCPNHRGEEPSSRNAGDQDGCGSSLCGVPCIMEFLDRVPWNRVAKGESKFSPFEMNGYRRSDWRNLEDIAAKARADGKILNSLARALTRGGSGELLTALGTNSWESDDPLADMITLRAICVQILTFIHTKESSEVLLAALTDRNAPSDVRALIPLALARGDVLEGERWRSLRYEEWRQSEERARGDLGFAASAIRPRLMSWPGPFGLPDSLSVVILPDGLRDPRIRDELVDRVRDASEEYDVRKSSLEALRWSLNEDPAAYDPLRETLLRVEDSDPERRDELRSLVEEALPRTWAQHFAEVELRLVSHDRLVSIISDPRETNDRRYAAARSMVRQADTPDAIRAAIDALLPVAMGEQVQSVREDVAWTLTSLPSSEWGHHNMIAYLRGLRYEPDSSFRVLFVSSAIDILGCKDDARRAREEMLRNDTDVTVRLFALDELRRENGGFASAPVLQEVVQNDPSDDVRIRASHILDDLRTKTAPSEEE